MERGEGRRAVAGIAVVSAAVLALATVGMAPAQYELPDGGYDPTLPGGGYDPGGGGTANAGKVKLELTGKKKQKSLKAVKVKATCRNRACTVDVKGKLKAGKKKAKLKPDEESLAEGSTDSLKLKFAKKARKTAKSAKRDDENLRVKVTARAKGVGGGGDDKASLKIKLKP